MRLQFQNYQKNAANIDLGRTAKERSVKDSLAKDRSVKDSLVKDRSVKDNFPKERPVTDNLTRNSTGSIIKSRMVSVV